MVVDVDLSISGIGAPPTARLSVQAAATPSIAAVGRSAGRALLAGRSISTRQSPILKASLMEKVVTGLFALTRNDTLTEPPLMLGRVPLAAAVDRSSATFSETLGVTN